MLCVCHTTPTQKLFCLHVFRQAGPQRRVDFMAPRWEIALNVFPKDMIQIFLFRQKRKNNEITL